jgi:predicted hydrolase (HD superfamily)
MEIPGMKKSSPEDLVSRQDLHVSVPSSPEDLAEWRGGDMMRLPKSEGEAFNTILAELGYAEEMRIAVMGHAHYTSTPRVTLLAKTLFAVDELSGLITASVLVRPDRSIHNLEVKSVMKKFKDKAFARGCNRDDIRLGAEEIGITLEQHTANCIEAMKPLSKQLFGA